MVQMNKSGLWKGVVHNRIGHFKFINVEILNERVLRRGEPERGKWSQRYRQKPGSVQELLQRMNLQVGNSNRPFWIHAWNLEYDLFLVKSLFYIFSANFQPTPIFDQDQPLILYKKIYIPSISTPFLPWLESVLLARLDLIAFTIKSSRNYPTIKKSPINSLTMFLSFQ